MFLNISSSMGSRVFLAERMAESKDGCKCTTRGRLGCSDGTSLLKNSIDNESNSPQYLGVASLHLLQLGNDFEFGPPFKGKLFTEETSCQQRKRLPRKRNTNRWRDDTSHTTESSEKPLERSTSPGVFYLIPQGKNAGKDWF